MNAVAVPLRAPPGLLVPPVSRRLTKARTWVASFVVVTVVAISQGVNMLRYPYLQVDEGTYFSQAWAVFHLGRLSPYTYFYDHTPLGWIQIALWQLVTGGHSFGYALASGRILMLIFQIASALLVFAIGRRSSGKVWVGLLAAVIFSLSSYGITYHRRILLDNVATFWLLLSVYLLVRPLTLRRVWLSGIAIGIAVLSKEIALAALPALAVLVARESPRSNRLFAVTGWLALAVSICSTYVLMALLKGEFFPAGTLLGGHHPHVSLLCSLEWQSSRGSDAGLLDTSSQFWVAARSWAHAEPLLVIGGSAAAVVAVVALRKRLFISMLGWTILSLWLFLGRGGVVLDFYLVPMLPLLALVLVLVMNEAMIGLRQRMPRKLPDQIAAALLGLAAILCGVFLVIGYERSDHGLWTKHPVDGQVQAVKWIDTHVPPSSRLVIDDYMWNDLHTPSSGAPAFPDAQYYWTVGEDPKLRRQAFGDDWRKVDYVVSTPQLVTDTRQQDFPVVAPALEHSVPIATFDTGGWEVQVRRVDPSLQSQGQGGEVGQQPLPGCMTYT
jgi:4-amino-4-deoxy-L-arabinose transferase-like glycosyltransferase